MQTKDDPECPSTGCWHSDYFKKIQNEKVIEYPDPEADGYDEDVGVTLTNAAAASS